MNRKFRDDKWLYKQYWNLKKSIRKIAKICEVSGHTIRYYMKKFYIPRRQSSFLGIGKENPNYKEDAKYRAIHNWVRKHNPIPEYCSNCGERGKVDLSSNGEYTRNINDYEWLCRSYHIKKDRGI